MDLVKWDKFERQIDTTRDLKELAKLHVELNAIQVLVKYSGQQEGARKVHNKAGKYKTKIEIQVGKIYKELPKKSGGDRKSEDYQNSDYQNFDNQKIETTKEKAVKETGKRFDTLARWAKEAEIVKDKEELLEKYEVKCNDDEKTEWTSKGFINFVINNEPKDNTDRLLLPEGKYRIIYADPPWQYPTAPLRKKVEEHFSTLPDEEIAEYTDPSGRKIKDLAFKDCTLFMWATTGKLDKAFPVIKAWGFQYKTSIIWDKVKYNMGNYTSPRHEFLLIAGKGSSAPLDKKVANNIDSVQVIEKTAKHSEKPEEFRKIIESLYPINIKNHIHIELFARLQNIEGWDFWGKEI